MKKVKVTYTTDFDMVPDDCFQILTNKINDGNSIIQKLKYIYHEFTEQSFDCMQTIEQIKQMRQILSEVDITLNDVQSILQGWNEIKLQDEAKQDT